MDFEKTYEQFIKEKTFLANVSPMTVKCYRDALSSYKRLVGAVEPTKQLLKNWIIQMMEAGLSVFTINKNIRTFNSFLTWYVENDYTKENMRMKKLKEPQKILKTFSDQQLRALLNWKPKDIYEHRLYAIIVLLIDTGIRIDEALTLTRENVLLEDFLIRVTGKGKKERYVPISVECRKVLFRYMNKHPHKLVFSTRHGLKLKYCNMLRYFKNHCRRLGIEGVRTSFHILRHGYALNHVREGGDVFSLQRILGHTDIAITKRYVGLTEDDLKMVHKKTSILGRLK
jgi:integrase/recombinase XerD